MEDSHHPHDHSDHDSKSHHNHNAPSQWANHESAGILIASPNGEYNINGSSEEVRLEIRGPDFVIIFPDGSENSLLMAGLFTATGQSLTLRFANGEVLTGDQFIARANYQGVTNIEHIVPFGDSPEETHLPPEMHAPPEPEERPEHPPEHPDHVHASAMPQASPDNPEKTQSFSEHFSRAMEQFLDDMGVEAPTEQESLSEFQQELEKITDALEATTNQNITEATSVDVSPAPSEETDPFVNLPVNLPEATTDASVNDGSSTPGAAFTVALNNIGAVNAIDSDSEYLGGGGSHESTTNPDISLQLNDELIDFSTHSKNLSIQGDAQKYFSADTTARLLT